MKSFKITIPSIVENVRIVESFIDNAREKYSISDDIYGNIIIAVTESVANSIYHGNKQDKNKNVSIILNCNDDEIVFTIKDEGEGFEIDNIPNPTDPENISKPGGRGIFLIKNLCDQYVFEDNGRSITLYFKTHNEK